MTITRLHQFTAENRITSDLKTFESGSPPTISNTIVHTGVYSYNLSNAQRAWGSQLPGIFSAVRASQWFYHSGFSNVCALFTATVGTGTNTARIRIVFTAATNELSIVRSGSSTPTETLAIEPAPSSFTNTATWIHLGFTYFANEFEGFISLYVNGVRVINAVGDTRMGNVNGFSTQIQHLFAVGRVSGITSNFPPPARVDDVFFDSYEGEVDAPVPARRFLPALPNGAGANTQWTPIHGAVNWENVDDNPHDADGTYNKAVLPDLRDTYQFSDVTIPVDHKIVAVIAQPILRRLDSELNQRVSIHAFDGANYRHSDTKILPMDYGPQVYERFTLQPDSTTWNEFDFNNMQFGVTSWGDF